MCSEVGRLPDNWSAHFYAQPKVGAKQGPMPQVRAEAQWNSNESSFEVCDRTQHCHAVSAVVLPFFSMPALSDTSNLVSVRERAQTSPLLIKSSYSEISPSDLESPSGQGQLGLYSFGDSPLNASRYGGLYARRYSSASGVVDSCHWCITFPLSGGHGLMYCSILLGSVDLHAEELTNHPAVSSNTDRSPSH